MAQLLELSLTNAYILPVEEASDCGLLVPLYVRKPIDEREMEERKRDLAKTALNAKGALRHLEAAVDLVPSGRNAVLDFGFDRFGSIPVAAVRWAPYTQDGVITSKILRLMPNGTDIRIIYPVYSEGWGGNPGVEWISKLVTKVEFGMSSFRRKLGDAMSNSTVRLSDNRTFDGENYIGNPGISGVVAPY